MYFFGPPFLAHITTVKQLVAGRQIPTIAEKPIKYLGKWFRCDLQDRESIDKVILQVNEWMTSIDRTGLPGKFKTWCYQFGILPRLAWPILMYDIPLTRMEQLERLLNRYIRKWLGVPRSFSSVGIYSKCSKLKLPITAVTEEFKVIKAREVMSIRDSQDTNVGQV